MRFRGHDKQAAREFLLRLGAFEEESDPYTRNSLPRETVFSYEMKMGFQLGAHQRRLFHGF